MSRNIIKRGATLLAATATTGALVLATPGLAQAATYDQGRSDSERSVTNGTGDADARANATDNGRLRVFTEADGDDAAGNPLPGAPTSTPTSATAQASLKKRVPVADGTYRVVVNYRDMAGVETDRGTDASANVERRSVVRFVSQTGGGDRQVQRVQELPTQESNGRTVLFIKVPDDSSGFLRISAVLRAVSLADGSQSFATGRAHVSDVSFRVGRV